jgi:para-nitrobenzyl esterase
MIGTTGDPLGLEEEWFDTHRDRICTALAERDRELARDAADLGGLAARRVIQGAMDAWRCDVTVEPLVFVEQGALLGHAFPAFPGLLFYRNVPYAEPPVGSLRFRAPRPPAPWDGTLDTTDAAFRACPRAAPAVGGEDCLVLHVVSHSGSYAPKPIVFVVHSGGMVSGSAWPNPWLAADADVVVVSINYRLGALASFAIPELAAEDPHGSAGNNSLLDAIAALHWTVRNARAFGGDPSRVTILGFSAGASLVTYMLASPLTRGLIWQAFAASPMYASGMLPSLDERAEFFSSAFERGEQIAEAAGCGGTPDTLACMRALPAAEVIAAGARVEQALFPLPETWPNVDGYALTAQPSTAMRRGASRETRIVIGSTRHEMSFSNTTEISSQTALEHAIRSRFSAARAGELIPLYASARFEGEPMPAPEAAYQALLGDLVFNCSAHAFARAAAEVDRRAPVHTYSFQRRVEGTNLAGAFHNLDAYFWFGTDFDALRFWNPRVSITPEDLELQSLMATLQGRFLHGEPLDGWPELEGSGPQVLVLDGVPPSLHDDGREGRCAALRGLGLIE